jgi:hypothetical protein
VSRRLFVAVCILTLIFPLTASAHTADEYEAWHEDWLARLESGQHRYLWAEHRDMKERHPEIETQAVVIGITGSYTTSSWESLIQIYFEKADWQWARDVIDCESDGDPDATHPTSGAAGLWQFIPSTWAWSKPWPEASPYNPTAAFMAARWLMDTYGKGQWACTAVKGY